MKNLKQFILFIASFIVAGFLSLFGANKGIEWLLRKRREILGIKTMMIIFLVLMLSGCASLSYTAPDGTKVTYTRFLTGSDTIKGTIKDARIESQGQKAIDPATLQAVFDILGKVK